MEAEQYLIEKGKEIIKEDQNNFFLFLPEYLKKFTLQNISKWAKNAVLAKNYFK